MKELFPIHATQFYTATIYDWQHVFNDDTHKEIIIESLLFLVNNKRIELNAFVIMRNHIHLIWQAISGFTSSDIQAAFMKYTAGQIRRSLMKTNAGLLASLKVNKYDREYQIWKREPLGIDLITKSLFIQKLEYIHYNLPTGRQVL
ncbi:MAG: transposase [Chitinophagaceae bacterium]|jgi:REP element-mobilizing transposase RayT|nr:transposase [Chitinophagaceae bacterium]